MFAWKEFALKPECELSTIDIVERNLACAAGLPGSESNDVAASLNLVKRMAERIKEVTQGSPVFGQNPAHYDHSEAIFRIHVLVSVLQHEFGVRYNPACTADDAPLRPEDVFLHGVLFGDGGTCSSIPVLFAAVGRRLGYPLKLNHRA